MKLLYSTLCVLVLSFESSHANQNLVSSSCGKDLFYSDGETVEKIVPLEDYIQTMHSLEVYDTKGLVDLEKDGLPDGMPRDPVKAYDELQIYPEHNKNMKILWRMLRKLQQNRGQESTTKKRKMSKKELQILMKEAQDFLEDEAARIIVEDGNEGVGSENEDEEAGNEDEEAQKKEGSDATQEQAAANTISRVYFRQMHRRENLLSLIREDNQITAAQIAGKLKISKSTIDSDISDLGKDLNNLKKVRLIRVGSQNTNLNGHWHVIEKGVKFSVEDFYEERKKKMLFLMWQDSRIKRDKLAKELGVSLPTISNITRELKNEGRLDKEGRTWLPLLTKEEEEEFEARSLKLFK